MPHRAQIAALQIEAFVELGVWMWVPTGTPALMAQMFILSGGQRANIITGTVRGGVQVGWRCTTWQQAGMAARRAWLRAAVPADHSYQLRARHPNPGPPSSPLQVPVPGLPCPVPVALVLRNGTVHVIIASMHETMAVLSDFHVAGAGPINAALCGCLGRAACPATLLRMLERYAELFDPVEAAQRPTCELKGGPAWAWGAAWGFPASAAAAACMFAHLHKLPHLNSRAQSRPAPPTHPATDSRLHRRPPSNCQSHHWVHPSSFVSAAHPCLCHPCLQG